MNLYALIKKDLLTARKNGDDKAKSFLSSLLAEADRELIFKQPEEKQQELMLSVVTKYAKGLEKSLEQFKGTGLEKQYTYELNMISVYLPAKLSLDEVKAILKERFGDDLTFPVAMKFLSSNYKGQFDAKEIKEKLFQL